MTVCHAMIWEQHFDLLPYFWIRNYQSQDLVRSIMNVSVFVPIVTVQGMTNMLSDDGVVLLEWMCALTCIGDKKSKLLSLYPILLSAISETNRLLTLYQWKVLNWLKSAESIWYQCISGYFWSRIPLFECMLCLRLLKRMRLSQSIQLKNENEIIK